MVALITGSNGFVGKYLFSELENNDYDVYGVDIKAGNKVMIADILDVHSFKNILKEVKPNVVFHLAAQASVGLSWKEPALTFSRNVIGTINILEAIKEVDLSIKLIIVGSSDQYGIDGAVNGAIDESFPLKPKSPYAISKKSQEDVALLYSSCYNMHICMTRSFNHTGPGQAKGFMIPDFCCEIADVEKGLKDYVGVGNLEAKRDYTDVRDVVRAYRLIAEKGKIGEIYNVGSGKVYSAQEILDHLISLSPQNVEVKIDPNKLRVVDTPVILCDNNKLINHTNWSTKITLDQTLKDSLEYYRGWIR